MLPYITKARPVTYDSRSDTIQPHSAGCDEEDLEELNLMYQAGKLHLTPVMGWWSYNYLAQAVCEDDLPMAWLVEVVDAPGLDDDLYGDE